MSVLELASGQPVDVNAASQYSMEVDGESKDETAAQVIKNNVQKSLNVLVNVCHRSANTDLCSRQLLTKSEEFALLYEWRVGFCPFLQPSHSRP